MHVFYGETAGVRIARKHLGWYSRLLPRGEELRAAFNMAKSSSEQNNYLERYVDQYQQDQMGLAA
jgi:tRNA-dihydrouridine synthase B